MKQFNLDEFKKNPSQKVVTRDGRDVRIICTDFKNPQPIVGLVTNNDDGEGIYFYYKDGRCFIYEEFYLDLFFAPVKREGWVNIYEGKNDTRTLGCLFSSEEEAIENKLIGHVSGYIKTIKIEWEE